MANLGYIQVVRRCNHHCLFCSNPSNGRSLTLDQAKRYVDDYVSRGYHGIILTGGEPTLFPALPQLIAHAAERGIHARMITNGHMLSNPAYVKRVVDAGLAHVHVSIFSYKKEIHEYLSDIPGVFDRAMEALENLGRAGAAEGKVTVNINCVINAYNADHLHKNVMYLTRRFPFIRHFVWNNLDPRMNRTVENRHVVHRLRDSEVSLLKAMTYLDRTGRTFRVERMPLCYMGPYAWASTETRKIIKDEERMIHFLDQKATVHQTVFEHEKAPACRDCRYEPICAGLYEMDVHYDAAELAPVFADPEEVIRRVRRAA